VGWGGTIRTLIALLPALAALLPASAGAATLTVNETGDQSDANPGNGACDRDAVAAGSQCTLRAAIEEANALGGTDDIGFASAIANCSASDVDPCTIDVTGGDISSPFLPPIATGTTVNGCSASPNHAGPCVGVRNSIIHADDGGLMSIGGNGVAVRGLAITNANTGLSSTSSATGATIENNWFGIKLDGSAEGNFWGVALAASASTVGGTAGATGTSPATRNVFGNNTVGLEIKEGDNNTVIGNFIGSASHPNGIGIEITPNVSLLALSNTIGGDTAAEQNVIAGNLGDGITISGTGDDQNKVLGNRGTGNGSTAFDLFVDLVGTNGPGNGLTGPNAGVAAPAITTATTELVSGTSLPNALVQVYLTTEAAGTIPGDVTGLLGTTTADGTGSWVLQKASFTRTVQGGDGLSASQTPATGSSELSAAVAVADTVAPETQITKGPDGRTTDRTPKFKFTSDDPDATFECKLDTKSYRSCTSPKTLKKLSFGKHVFRVRASDTSGNTDSTPPKRSFRVVR
jgi:CSLREA domain-containing protein